MSVNEDSAGSADAGGNDQSANRKSWVGRVNGKNATLPKSVLMQNIPKKVMHEIKEVMAANNKRGAIKDKSVGSKTQENRYQDVIIFFKILFHEGYRIETIKNLKQKHFHVVFRFMEKCKQSPKTIIMKVSTMRTFCGWINKPGMVSDTNKYVENAASVKSSMVCQVDKSWSGNNVDPMKILADVRSYRGGKEEVVAVWLEQCWAFGLRIRESVMMIPTIGDGGNALFVREGSKGGRDRNIPIRDEIQSRVLEKSKAIADKVTGFLGKRGDSVEQKLQHFYYIMRRVGVTLSQKGVTSHGLRHEYIQAQHKLLTGVDAPIKGGNISYLDKIEYREVSRALMFRMGHGRLSIGASYYGSRQGVRRQKNRNKGGNENNKTGEKE